MKTKTLTYHSKPSDEFSILSKKKACYSANCLVISDIPTVKKLSTKLGRIELPYTSQRLNNGALALWIPQDMPQREVYQHYVALDLFPDKVSILSIARWMVENEAGCILSTMAEYKLLLRDLNLLNPALKLSVMRLRKDFCVGTIIKDTIARKKRLQPNAQRCLLEAIASKQKTFILASSVSDAMVKDVFKEINLKNFKIQRPFECDFRILVLT